jgi:hypothetical protein
MFLAPPSVSGLVWLEFDKFCQPRYKNKVCHVSDVELPAPLLVW